MNWNSGFSVGGIGIGDDLIKNPLGGFGGLNIGGFSGNVPSYGAGGTAGPLAGAFSPNLGFLTAAGGALAGRQAANLNAAAQNNFLAQNAMFDANFGKDFLAQNVDRFRSFSDPVRAAQISVNSSPYRQSLNRANLPELAGKYGSFGAFAYS